MWEDHKIIPSVFLQRIHSHLWMQYYNIQYWKKKSVIFCHAAFPRVKPMLAAASIKKCYFIWFFYVQLSLLLPRVLYLVSESGACLGCGRPPAIWAITSAWQQRRLRDRHTDHCQVHYYPLHFRACFHCRLPEDCMHLSCLLYSTICPAQVIFAGIAFLLLNTSWDPFFFGVFFLCVWYCQLDDMLQLAKL